MCMYKKVYKGLPGFSMSVRLSVEVTLVTGLRARVRRMETPNQEGSSILTSYYQVLDPWFRSWRHQHDGKSTPSLTQNPLQHIYVCPSPPCKIYLDYHSIKSPGKDFGEGHWDCMIENPPRSRRHFPQLPSQITEPSDPGHGNLAGSGKEGQGHFLKSQSLFPTFTLSADSYC